MFAKKLQGATVAVNAILVLMFLLIVWLIIYGNLSGNLGFADGSQGFNDTQNVINNATAGVAIFSSFAPTWFTILAIVLLIFILIALLYVVMKIAQPKGSGGGYSGM